jgi:hypothetical protein
MLRCLVIEALLSCYGFIIWTLGQKFYEITIKIKMDTIKYFSRKQLFFGVILSVVCVLGVYFYWKSTPSYSLWMLKKAINNSSFDDALPFINIDAIVDNLLDQAFNDMEPSNVWEAIGVSVVENARPVLQRRVRATLHKIVEGSSIDKDNTFFMLKAFTREPYKIKHQNTVTKVFLEEDNRYQIIMKKSEKGVWQIINFLRPTEKSLSIVR